MTDPVRWRRSIPSMIALTNSRLPNSQLTWSWRFGVWSVCNLGGWSSTSMRLIVAITGATGVIYGVRLLERLRDADVETHLVMSRWGARTLLHETPYSRAQVEALATEIYAPNDMGAAIASGSFEAAGMIIAPCSVKTLAAVAHGYGDSLVHRAADVTLKERRKLLLSVREAPLSEIHLENMLKLARMGAVILPPMPAFYMHPQTLDEVIDHTVLRMLDQFGIEVAGAPRWTGEMGVNPSTSRGHS